MSKSKVLRSLSIYEPMIRRLGEFRIVHALPSEQQAITALGFISNPVEGDSIVPAPVGKVSEFNANGKFVIRKDLPKVSDSRMVWSTWNDWHGQPHSGIQIRSIDVYPRDRVLPPNEYLTVLRDSGGQLLSSRALSLSVDTEESVVHLLNLYLELFGELEIVSQSLESVPTVQVKRLNWRVLPPGQYPFSRVKGELVEYINALSPEVRPVIEDRIKTITQYNPDFIAVGIGGFRDYAVFGFKAKDVYILESPSIGNATYVFKGDWVALSSLTKKQILDGSLHEARLIHNRRWRAGLREAIK